MKRKFGHRQTVNAIFLMALVILTQCTTTPATRRLPENGEISLEGKDVLTVVLPHLSDAKEIAAFNAGLLTATKSEKIVPTLPDALKPVARELIINSIENRSTSRPSGVIDYAKKVAKFNTLLLVLTDSTQIVVSVFGFPLSSDPGLLVRAVLYDVEKDKVLAVASEATRLSDQGRLLNIGTSGKDAVNTLLGK